MGLFDFFRRGQDHELVEIDRRVARLEGRLESIEAAWLTYREQFTRLAQRLEKREQRAAEKDQVAGEGEAVEVVNRDVLKARSLRAFQQRRGS